MAEKFQIPLVPALPLSCTKTGNRAVVRNFLPCQEPHEVDIPAACSFNLPGRINVLEISIRQNLEHAFGPLPDFCLLQSKPDTAMYNLNPPVRGSAVGQSHL